MNICFLIGKIVKNIEFKFILDDKNISIAYTSLILSNDSCINIKGYNNLADILYARYNVNDIVLIKGKLDEKMEIVINDIVKLWGWFNLI